MASEKEELYRRLDKVIHELAGALYDLVHNYNITDPTLIPPMKKLGEAVDHTIAVLHEIRESDTMV